MSSSRAPLSTALSLAVVVAATSASAPVAAQGRDFSKVQIKTTQLTDTLYMLQGAGGNIGVSAGGDGVYLIDDQFAPLSEKILAAVRAISKEPLRFVINTHWHGDHTGGNENMAQAGATVMAHRNVRERMAKGQPMPAFNRVADPAPEAALPQITYDDGVELHLNGETARIRHVPSAHTDGDSFVHFTASNVLHTGDLFFNGFYPFIDAWSGGNINGVIDAAGAMLEMADDQTRIIPGHGPLASRADLEAYRAMLIAVRDTVSKGIRDGLNAQALVDSGAFADIEEEWGDGFLDTAKFITIVYAGLADG